MSEPLDDLISAAVDADSRNIPPLQLVSGLCGAGLGLGYVYAIAQVVGEGPYLAVAAPLCVGIAGAVLVARRRRNRYVIAAAEWFAGACLMTGLLFLAAG